MIVVEGADQLNALADSLKKANLKLEAELHDQVKKAMKPLRQALKASALETLPKGGGLAAKIAKSSMRTIDNRSGVRLRATNPYVLQRLDRGSVRHPVFGDRAAWVTQQVPPGWWTKPTEAVGPQVRAAIVRAMDEIASQI